MTFTAALSCASSSSDFPTAHACRPLGRMGLGFAVSVALFGTACGGADDEVTALKAAPAHAAAPGAKAPQRVALQGCVVDRFYVPTTGASVRALAADGRLLGHAQSDGQGRFTMHLPAASVVTLQLDRLGGESLPTRIGSDPTAMAPCLLDDQA